MLLKNCNIVFLDRIEKGSLLIENGIIKELQGLQPPTPMTRSGFACLSSRTRPRSCTTFSCAFSRTEQVLKRMTSAFRAASTTSEAVWVRTER